MVTENTRLAIRTFKQMEQTYELAEVLKSLLERQIKLIETDEEFSEYLRVTEEWRHKRG
jgi:hypothetical protein